MFASLAVAAALNLQTSLLDRVKAALTTNGPAWNETRVTGEAQYYGEPHHYRFLFKPDGSFVESFEGPIAETFGSDGKQVWEMDRSRAIQKLDFEDRDENLAVALVLSSGWIDASAPVKLSESAGKVIVRLQPSGQPETLTIDPNTNLPTEVALPVSSGTLELKLSEWKEAGNRRVPMHVEVTEGGLTDKIAANRVEEGQDETAPFAVPDWKPTDISFENGKPSKAES